MLGGLKILLTDGEGIMEKTINVNYQLGRNWYKVCNSDKKPTGEEMTHFSLQQYYTWDSVRFPSCSGRRFDESNNGAERKAEL